MNDGQSDSAPRGAHSRPGRGGKTHRPRCQRPAGDHRPGSGSLEPQGPRHRPGPAPGGGSPVGGAAGGGGLTRHMDGRLGQAAPEILALVETLKEALGVEVVAWEERLTTVEAERVLIQADVSRRRRRQVVDQLAAVLILQNYLDHRQQHGGG